MTTTIRTIEVPLPEGALASTDDLDVLRHLLSAVAALRFGSGERWARMRQSLERSGWDVRWSLQWHVEARRGREMEQACGRTLEEAFGTVSQVARSPEPLEGPP